MLRLLGEGHTAKSAAAELGVSIDAVNGRLREARRKTGTGSSRELARRVRDPQETGDDFPEVVDTDAPGAGLTPSTGRAQAAGDLKGRFTMTVLACAICALIVGAPLGGGRDRAAGAPRVVATTPAAGAQVAAGPLKLSVSFDRPMLTGGYSLVMRDRRSFPDCAGEPLQSADARTFTWSCVVASRRDYEVRFNSPRFRNFVSAADQAPAVPSTLRFSTR